jgi:glucosamine kinase
MAEHLFLGVDGGGTTTRARLTDAAGTVLGEGRAGTSNLNMGIASAAESIIAATREALGNAGLDDVRMGDIVAGFGLAGANVQSLANALNAHPFPFARVTLASDAVTACLGAHDGEDGAILILGTGSQGLVLVDGEARTVGGWGFELSDEGSGAVLGRAAIRASILSYDGIIQPSGLTAAILARFENDPSIAAVWGKTATPGDYGAFAPVVFAHFDKDDPVAADLLKESSIAVGRLLDRLIALGATRISLMGGLADAYRPLLDARFATFLVPRKRDALDGALALAHRGDWLGSTRRTGAGRIAS